MIFYYSDMTVLMEMFKITESSLLYHKTRVYEQCEPKHPLCSVCPCHLVVFLNFSVYRNAQLDIRCYNPVIEIISVVLAEVHT